MKLVIEQSDIDKANWDVDNNCYSSKGHCPVEYSLLRQGYINPKATQYSASAIFQNKVTYLYFSGNLTDQIKKWDCYRGFEPGTYICEVR